MSQAWSTDGITTKRQKTHMPTFMENNYKEIRHLEEHETVMFGLGPWPQTSKALYWGFR